MTDTITNLFFNKEVIMTGQEENSEEVTQTKPIPIVILPTDAIIIQSVN